MKHIIAYEGHKVALAAMQEAYVPLFVPWINHRVGIEGTLLRPPYSIKAGLEWVRGLDKCKGKDEVFAILIRNSPRTYRYIGHTGIHGIKWPDGIGTTGSVISFPEGRGKGYGTEAKLLLLYHSFHILGLRKMVSRVKEFNAQSLGHLLKCGYQIIGRHKRHVWHDGACVDEILLEIFPEEFEEIWKQYKEIKQLPKLTAKQRALVKKETSSN